ncbi:rna polymerase sigma-h factor : : Sigma70_r2 [Gemmata massiliana]|uniref:Rna polymerase sigma-h factor:: Sigma70_r2 n=1 Tax=Gemmata massiliana TaxID=1210884 RepID=A0A6P2DK68_9BACT|nr:sigma-70 family RNA polymerase sigma factor [Gemmata massiliana]VTS00788.1 rna polymerase sigma-h factor : : Sigma70_r2 [Gemmata massiliana]
MSATTATKLSDAELAHRAQAGDSNAVNQLVTRYKPQVWRQTWKMRMPAGVEHDDIASVGLQTLWRCVLKWRPDGGASFRVYAWTAVCRALKRAVGREEEVLHRQPVQCDPDSGDDLFDITPAREPVVPPAGIRQWLRELHPTQRLAIERVFGLNGTPDALGVIANDLGLSIPQLKTACQLALAS